MQKIIDIRRGTTRMKEWQMAAPVDFTLCNGEHIAITGLNASGKSKLVDILRGAHPLAEGEARYDFAPSTKPLVSDNIKYIAFRDSYGTAADATYYLQKRWNQHDMDDDTPPTMLLSSGELRRHHLRQALEASPRVLIIDNPFIGLDTAARRDLQDALDRLASQGHVQIILVLPKASDIPQLVTHVVEVSEGRVMPKETRRHYLDRQPTAPAHVLGADQRQAIAALPHSARQPGSEVVSMRRVSISYGGRTILQPLNWTVRAGDRWALTGPNGSGKSTLLSLVCADNPQSYACDISLFGRKRGTGESIWDIKRNIGYVSPEMHRAYQKNLPAERIVASGLKDSVGLYVKPTEADISQSRWWMAVFGIEGLASRPFLQLSSGEQRLVLLARAFVKDPDLLILDEPLHGLDTRRSILAKDIIETWSSRPSKTLIMVTHYDSELPPNINHRMNLAMLKR